MKPIADNWQSLKDDSSEASEEEEEDALTPVESEEEKPKPKKGRKVCQHAQSRSPVEG